MSGLDQLCPRIAGAHKAGGKGPGAEGRAAPAPGPLGGSL